MMLVVYIGPADAVTLAPAAGGAHFPWGAAVEVDDDLGRRLIAQGTFRKGRPRAKPGFEER